MKKKYKFDPHTHTSESSGCSVLRARELVESYHKAGFGGIAITDHLADYSVSGYGDWDASVDYFLQGYKAAKAHGDKIGIDVILGAEVRFDTSYNDYLLYGIDEDFLRKNPYIYRLGLREVFKRHGSKLLIIQAHPYRSKGSPDIGFLHGVEAYNGNPWHDNRNKRAQKLCDAHPGLYAISASDAHEPDGIGTGWMEFDRPVVDSFQFREMVMSRKYVLGK